jgi:hypothetical protein
LDYYVLVVGKIVWASDDIIPHKVFVLRPGVCQVVFQYVCKDGPGFFHRNVGNVKGCKSEMRENWGVL